MYKNNHDDFTENTPESLTEYSTMSDSMGMCGDITRPIPVVNKDNVRKFLPQKDFFEEEPDEYNNVNISAHSDISTHRRFTTTRLLITAGALSVAALCGGTVGTVLYKHSDMSTEMSTAAPYVTISTNVVHTVSSSQVTHKDGDIVKTTLRDHNDNLVAGDINYVDSTNSDRLISYFSPSSTYPLVPSGSVVTTDGTTSDSVSSYTSGNTYSTSQSTKKDKYVSTTRIITSTAISSTPVVPTTDTPSDTTVVTSVTSEPTTGNDAEAYVSDTFVQSPSVSEMTEGNSDFSNH